MKLGNLVFVLHNLIGISRNLSREMLIYFNIFGFVGSVFLISASYAIFRTAVEVDDEVDKLLKAEQANAAADENTQSTASSLANNLAPVQNKTVEVSDRKLQLYAELLKYLRIILYVGAFMLVVGILPMDFMMKWHLAFI